MAAICVNEIKVLNNPAPFQSSLSFEIQFECLQDLSEDCEWKFVYVGCSSNPDYDQILDSVWIGPLEKGLMKFTVEIDPPVVSKIPTDEVLGISAIILTCSYKNQEFYRCGYYVNNSYEDEALQFNPPATPLVEKIKRDILDQPTISRITIDWGLQPVQANSAVPSQTSVQYPATSSQSIPQASQQSNKVLQ